MTPAEVDSVLALWRDVEGTMPPELVLHRDHNDREDFVFTLDGNPGYVELSDAKASDLICGHLRRWLEERCCDYRIRFSREKGYFVAWSVRPGDLVHSRIGETLLLALIAAVRAVAGTTGQTQTQGGASLRDANTTRTVFPGLGSATSYEVAGDLKRALSTGAAQMPGGQDDPNTPTAADAAGEPRHA